MVDAAWLPVTRIRPVGQSTGLDATEDLVELVLAHQEGIVLDGELLAALDEVERHPIVQFDAKKRAEPDGRTAPQQLRQERCRGLRIAGVDDGVVQFDRHEGMARE